MEIRYKLYPYPVLAYYSDDYSGSSFETAIDAKHEGYTISLDCMADIDNEELSKLVEDGSACIVYHLECAQTGFRVALQTSNSEYKYVISDKDVRGRLQICPFIVAMKDIPGYVNKSFHEDYRGFKFAIEAGCVLAVGKQVNFDIDTDINDFANTPSVFSIVKNADEAAIGMVVDIDKNKIVIKLPEKDYFNCKSIMDVSDIQPVLNSLVVIPALIYTLEELSKREPSERSDEYSRYGWYRAVKKALSVRLNCDIEGDSFASQNMLDLAQRLINTPISDGLKALSSSYAAPGEEDEE